MPALGLLMGHALLCQTTGAARAEEKAPVVGLMVMAHGGTPEWNAAVEEAVAPLRAGRPVAIAFGMADRAALQQAVSDLEAQGATRIATVRLFISGHSFKHQTEYFLGLRPDPPARFIDHAGHGGHGGHGDHAGHAHDAHAGHSHGSGHDHAAHGGGHGEKATADRRPIERQAEIALSVPGLDEDATVAAILSDRAKAMSKKPRQESVLLLAHGVEDDAENDKIFGRLQAVSHRIARHGFADVRFETLREDWPEKRAAAEKRIRDYVTSQTQKKREVLVLPVRVFGFGPYKEALTGLSYRAGDGLLPHAGITRWIERQYRDVCASAGWEEATQVGERQVAPGDRRD